MFIGENGNAFFTTTAVPVPGQLGKLISLVFGKKGYQEAFPFSSRTRSGSFKNIKITETSKSIAYNTGIYSIYWINYT